MADFLDPDLGVLAAKFRAKCGISEGDQFDVEAAIIANTLLWIERIDGLTVGGVQAWLHQRNYQMMMGDHGPERELFGCLVIDCESERGYIFVDGLSSDLEQRFTIAHELAHYLRDYEYPRERALARWGESIRAVLEGTRAPTIDEQLDAVLSAVPLGLQHHLMLRGDDGSIQRTDLRESELAADHIALELLAPHRSLIAEFGTVGYTPQQLCEQVLPILQIQLPEPIARRYAVQLGGYFGRRSTLVDWLR